MTQRIHELKISTFNTINFLSFLSVQPELEPMAGCFCNAPMDEDEWLYHIIPYPYWKNVFSNKFAHKILSGNHIYSQTFHMHKRDSISAKGFFGSSFFYFECVHHNYYYTVKHLVRIVFLRLIEIQIFSEHTHKEKNENVNALISVP